MSRKQVSLAGLLVMFLCWGEIQVSQAVENEVRVQNSVTSDDTVTQSDVDLRVVMVHLQTEEKKVFEIKANETKPIGKLTEGHWAVVMTRKINNKPFYVGGGLASVTFSKTLIGLFNGGVDAADDSN